MINRLTKGAFLLLLIVVFVVILRITHARGLQEVLILAVMAIIEIAGLILISLLFNLYVSARMKKLSQRYDENEDMGEYLGTLEHLEKLFGTRAYKFAFANNKSYVYAKKKDYETALKLLQDIDPKVIKGNETLYYANMAACAYRTVDGKFATECMEKINPESFKKYKNSKRDDLKRVWYFDTINYTMYIGKYEEAKEMTKEFYDLCIGTGNTDALCDLQKKFPAMFEELDLSL